MRLVWGTPAGFKARQGQQMDKAQMTLIDQVGLANKVDLMDQQNLAAKVNERTGRI
jgi:hypothetical protein